MVIVIMSDFLVFPQLARRTALCFFLFTYIDPSRVLLIFQLFTKFCSITLFLRYTSSNESDKGRDLFENIQHCTSAQKHSFIKVGRITVSFWNGRCDTYVGSRYGFKSSRCRQ